MSASRLGGIQRHHRRGGVAERAVARLGLGGAAMSERRPWFRCEPSKLIGALGGMGPESGYVFVMVLLRIYDVGGPIVDTADVLARRTGISPKRVAAALDWLIQNGKIQRLYDGRLDAQSTHEELAAREKRIDDATNAGNSSTIKRGKKLGIKGQQFQQNEPTLVEPSFNYKEKHPSSLRSEGTLSPASLEREKENNAAFDRFIAAYPHKVSVRKAREVFHELGLADEIDAILNGVQRYIRTKPPDRAWLNPENFLKDRRWEDQTGPPVSNPKTFANADDIRTYG
jgi:hypothetical protein